MHLRDGVNKKVIGSTNFMAVLWTLLSLLRLSVAMGRDIAKYLFSVDFITFVIPLIFLTVLNLFIGITSFSKKRLNGIWVVSLIVLTITLISLNSIQLKIEQIKLDRKVSHVLEF